MLDKIPEYVPGRRVTMAGGDADQQAGEDYLVPHSIGRENVVLNKRHQINKRAKSAGRRLDKPRTLEEEAERLANMRLGARGELGSPRRGQGVF